MFDINRPSTWKFYKAGMCQGCNAGCCMMPVEVQLSDLVRLGIVSPDEVEGSKKKLFKRLHKEGVVSSYREGTGFFILSQKNISDCYFLDSKTRLCTVYEKRPEVCRAFPSIGPRPGFCPHKKT